MAIEVHAPGLRLVAVEDDTVLELDPLQGLWTEAQYLRLSAGSQCLLEFADGSIEVLRMPTDRHQVIQAFLFFALYGLMQRLGGIAVCAPLRLQVRAGKFREPDLVLLRDAEDPRRQNAYWRGADLVVEIISPDDRERDTVVKRGDYAAASIPEYWIVDPAAETFTVLRLAGAGYVEHGVFRRGDTATSIVLAGFSVDVSAVLDAGRRGSSAV